MPRCKECDITFEDHDNAHDHVRDEHADECDECLHEYIPESIDDAYANLIDDGEEDE